MISCEMLITTRLSAAVISRQISLTGETRAHRRGRNEPKALFLRLRFLYPRRCRFSESRWLDSGSPDASERKRLFALDLTEPASAVQSMNSVEVRISLVIRSCAGPPVES